MSELKEEVLGAVTGGIAEDPSPSATGGVTYKCIYCHQTINASSRDVIVTCPNMKCRARFKVSGGSLVPAPATP